jgi:outer membrane receptor protein involved in Fe transport
MMRCGFGALQVIRTLCRLPSGPTLASTASRNQRGTGRAWALGIAALAVGLGAVAAAAEEPRPTEVAPAQEEPADSAEDEPGPRGPPTDVEVIKVRGRRVAEIATDVPTSVTAFDPADIEALGAQDVADLSRVTPNVSIVQPGTQATFFVRGVGLSDFSSNAAGAVTILQDGVALNAPALQTGQLYDIEAVEVLRGPQGSGAYRNASAGAIVMRSRRPTGNYSAQLRSTLGRYSADSGKGAHSAMIQDYEGALELPIYEDAGLSSRFAFRFRDAGPYITNGCGGATSPATGINDAICGERLGLSFGAAPVQLNQPTRVGDQHNWSARGNLGWSPPGRELVVFGNLHGSRLDQQSVLGQVLGTGRLSGVGVPTLGGPTGSSYQEPDQAEEYQDLCNQRNPGSGLCRDSSGNNIPAPQARATVMPAFERNLTHRPLDRRPFRGDYRFVGPTKLDTWGAFLSAEWELRGINFFALTSYDTYERLRDQDTDFTPDLLFEQVETDEAWQVYNELHFGGELPDAPLAWELGGYYLQEELSVQNTTFINNPANPTVPGLFLRDYSQTTQSLGIWGEFAWNFSDDFTLEGGVRYNWERKRFPFRLDTRNVLLQPGSNVQEETWHTPTGQIILTWHIDEGSQAYARYTRGFKAGHFNAQATQDLDEPPADPEFNDAWEVGLRGGGWLDDRLTGALSLFYYKYTGYQVFLFRDQADRPPVLEILNADEAENYGLELEGHIEPLLDLVPPLVEGLRIGANFSLLHGEYLDFQVTTTVKDGPALLPAVIDFSGNPLTSSPRYKVSATVEWSFDLDRWGVLTPRYDFSWEADQFFDPNEGRGTQKFDTPSLPAYTVAQRAYFLHNVRLSYRIPTGNVELAFWARNITDEVYKIYAFDASNFADVVLNFVGEPRTLGFDLTCTF